VPVSRFREAGLLDVLLQLAGLHEDALTAAPNEKAEAIDTLDA
jgi:hypothetical protein